jgi:hypothetical protein
MTAGKPFWPRMDANRRECLHDVRRRGIGENWVAAPEFVTMEEYENLVRRCGGDGFDGLF